ncbi:MAG: thymidylate kinase [Candidatus Acidiferrales bacterium]
MDRDARFIAIEGIDGAGKRTQIELLTGWLDARGTAHQRISFPRYDSFFGRMVGQFLDGAFGPLDRVDAHLSAMLYASDRFEAKPQLEKILHEQRKTLVADRYIASNLAHQTARVPPEQREEFLHWLKQLEYDVYGLPVEDLVIYLRVPARVAQQQVAQKSARGYTARSHDLLEADLRHLEEAATVYDRLARASNWVTVECFDAAASRMRAPDAIHQEVVKAVEAFGFSSSRRQEVRK